MHQLLISIGCLVGAAAALGAMIRLSSLSSLAALRRAEWAFPVKGRWLSYLLLALLTLLFYAFLLAAELAAIGWLFDLVFRFGRYPGE